MEYRYKCNRCPFSTNDPQGVNGHENHGPKNGWLGQNETHKMVDRKPAK
jgi:hypothetical protein